MEFIRQVWSPTHATPSHASHATPSQTKRRTPTKQAHRYTQTKNTYLSLQQRQGLLEHTIALQRRSRITVLQTAVVDAHDLVGALDHLGVDGALDRLLW